MPREPREIRPIRKIRTTLGLTQKQMGELLGISARTVERLENGTLKLPRRIYEQYYRTTGAHPDCIVGKPGDPVITREENPFTRDKFREFEQSCHLLAEEQIQTRTEALKLILEYLLLASHSDRRKKLIRFSEDVAALMADLIKTNGLEEDIADAIQQKERLTEQQARGIAQAFSTAPFIVPGLITKAREKGETQPG